MSEFVVGQRWVSHTEASLGLGIVIEVEHRRVVMSFPAVGEQRTYAMNNAPLGRVCYKVDDVVRDVDGEAFKVTDLIEKNKVVFYKVLDADGEPTILPELELDCFVQFNSPKDRLLSGQIDPYKFYALRQETLEHLRAYQQSGVQGLLGPRVQLLPHQLYIASQVANRNAPRVLLADEVGLGKTIEAGLIIHQQLQTGLAQRVLVLVPDSLLHQWLVEMRRRFNLAFSILNDMMCEEAFEESENPFLASQLVLCPLSFLIENPERDEQALACDWDLLVVDEAHHLNWSVGQVSEEYECVERFARQSHGVLLLTATPEQLGVEGHFARLRLLDPDRYHDLDLFLAEQKDYQEITQLVHEVMDARFMQAPLPEKLEQYLTPQEWKNITADFATDEDVSYNKAIDALLDRHGTGRVLFRNTRSAVAGFPERHVTKYELSQVLPEDEAEVALLDRLQPENFYPDTWLQQDARIEWLVRWLGDHMYDQVLLICANAQTAIDLEKYLRMSYSISSAVFHEGMSLVERDRAAAYFADEENSAQILVCSEIGSEGRNFQFVNNVILFDLPLNPDLLEQRIGRLDRIGQMLDVNIHVPIFVNSEQEILYRWYQQGLNAFEKTCAIGRPIFDKFESQLMTCLKEKDADKIDALIADTRKHAKQLRAAMQQGRDQLLEMNSCRVHAAEEIIDRVVETENRKGLELFIEKACNQLGIESEVHSANTIILSPGEHMHGGLLPGMEEDGITATFSRELALSREDMHFLSWEHPTVKGMMDSILSGHHGSTSFSTLKLKALKEGTLLLEGLFTVQCIAPAHLRIDRYLPATVVRVLVNLQGKDLSAVLPADKLNSLLKSVPPQSAGAVVKNAHSYIETLMEQATTQAQTQLDSILDAAIKKAVSSQEQELFRLQNLAEINSNIRQSEIDAVKSQAVEIVTYLEMTALKSDAVRLIMSV